MARKKPRLYKKTVRVEMGSRLVLRLAAQQQAQTEDDRGGEPVCTSNSHSGIIIALEKVTNDSF